MLHETVSVFGSVLGSVLESCIPCHSLKRFAVVDFVAWARGLGHAPDKILASLVGKLRQKLH